MDKVEDLFDKINALVKDFNMDREHGSLLLLGADFYNVCGNLQGKLSNIISLLLDRMTQNENIKIIVLEAAKRFLESQECIIEKNKKEAKHGTN